MPLTLNVNISKKVGEPDYGSRGASVTLQQELDTSLVGQPHQLQAEIRELFQQARDAVEQELFGRNGHANGAAQQRPSQNGGNGTSSRNGRRATQSQVKAIYAITNQHRIDLNEVLAQQFHVDRPEDLSLPEASRLIDELKAAQTGGGRR